jgi:signal transduction histidine kinase
MTMISAPRTMPPPAESSAAAPPAGLCDVLALVGHELRTPLTTLGAALDLLEGAEPADQAMLLERAQREIRRLRLLFEASIRSTELVMSAGEYIHEQCDAGVVIEGALRDLDPALYGVSLTVALEPGLQAPVDGAALTIILHNLLANAFRHARATTLHVSAGRERGAIVIAVADDGAGFKPAPARRGSGLGLFVIERLLGRFGGRLDVTTTPGGGTTCTIRIPEAGQ